MKTSSQIQPKGSVLLVALLTIAILAVICATSLQITSQNTSTGMQTASWQQALTGTESGVDAAIRALNENGVSGANAWTNWISVSQSGTSVPTTEPSASPSPATGPPDSTHYNYLPSSKLTTSFSNNEGATSVSTWVTIDRAGMLASQDTYGNQWYRVRATGQANVSGPARVSNNRLDSDLRNTIALKFNRKGGNNLGPTRTVEVILAPASNGTGILLKNWLVMSGGGTIHGDVGMLNSSGSDLHSTYLYGNLFYSGTTAPKNTTDVQGNIVTPYSATITAPTDPTWASGTYTSVSAGNPGTLAAGNGSNPTYYKVSGDLTVSGGNTLLIQKHDNSSGNKIYIWVTGKLTTSGSGYIQQDSNVQVTWYVDGDITVSGDSYQNTSGRASYLTINGIGTNNKFTDSGSGTFTGTVNAPGYDATVSGSGAYTGSLIANDLTVSGGASFNQSGGGGSLGNYAFASWFEDNSDPTHKDVNGYYIIY